jgi:hypothetical protein
MTGIKAFLHIQPETPASKKATMTKAVWVMALTASPVTPQAVTSCSTQICILSINILFS